MLRTKANMLAEAMELVKLKYPLATWDVLRNPERKRKYTECYPRWFLWAIIYGTGRYSRAHIASIMSAGGKPYDVQTIFHGLTRHSQTADVEDAALCSAVLTLWLCGLDYAHAQAKDYAAKTVKKPPRCRTDARDAANTLSRRRKAEADRLKRPLNEHELSKKAEAEDGVASGGRR